MLDPEKSKRSQKQSAILPPQLVQEGAPDEEYCPATQSLHADDATAFAEDEYIPLAQLEQLDAPPCAWYAPAGQSAQAEVPRAAAYVPAPQLEQLVANPAA
jgi:hypothetical protein